MSSQMVLKHATDTADNEACFRSMSSQMVLKLIFLLLLLKAVLDLCHLKWY